MNLLWQLPLVLFLVLLLTYCVLAILLSDGYNVPRSFEEGYRDHALGSWEHDYYLGPFWFLYHLGRFHSWLEDIFRGTGQGKEEARAQRQARRAARRDSLI